MEHEVLKTDSKQDSKRRSKPEHTRQVVVVGGAATLGSTALSATTVPSKRANTHRRRLTVHFQSLIESGDCDQQCPLFDDNRRSVYPGSERFDKSRTQADRPDGSSPSGSLRVWRRRFSSFIHPPAWWICRIADCLCLPCGSDRLVLLLKAPE